MITIAQEEHAEDTERRDKWREQVEEYRALPWWKQLRQRNPIPRTW